jgi:Uma2 family endonuclease
MRLNPWEEVMLRAKWTGDLAYATPTLSDLIDALGGIDPDRMLMVPAPGTATVADVERYECELIEGTLVRKATDFRGSVMTAHLICAVGGFARADELGVCVGPTCFWEVLPGVARAPCVAFISWDRVPGRKVPKEPVPRLAPDLAVDVIYRGNTPGELARKRDEFFGGGTETIWSVDLDERSVTVYSRAGSVKVLTATDTLDGGDVLPGFSLPLADYFADLDRRPFALPGEESPDTTGG